MEKPVRRRNRIDPTAFDDVFEDKEGVASKERLPLGTRVVRGPDWKWNNQDGGMPGTVVQHEEHKHPFTWVLWDEGSWNRYPYGSEMGYHIWKTEEHPVLMSEDGEFQIGMTVKKGPNWNSSETKYDQKTGVVIRKSRHRRQVKVRWENGVIEVCSVNAVVFSDCFENEKDRVSETFREEDVSQSEPEEEENDESKVPVWQWRDDWGNWRLYPQQEMKRLEAAYQRKKDGSCVLQRGTKQVRILFQRKTEKDVDKHMERDIQRVFLPLHELQSLEVAEQLVSNE